MDENSQEPKPIEVEQISPPIPPPENLPAPPPAERNTITRLEKKLVAAVPPSGEVAIDDKTFIKARRKLGLPKDQWSLQAIRAKEQLGQFMGVKLTARVMLVNTIDSFEQVQKVFEVAGKMAREETLDADIRVKALGMITEAGKVAGQLSEHIMTLAEKANEAEKIVKPPGGVNLPPSFGFEVTAGEGEQKVTARVLATNGQPS